MAAATSDLDHGTDHNALRERHESDGEELRTSHLNNDDLAVSLYHHVVRACHVHLRDVDRYERNTQVTPPCSKRSEDLKTTGTRQHGTQGIAVGQKALRKGTSTGTISKKDADRDKSRSRFADAVTRLLLWGDVITGSNSATLALSSQSLHHNIIELLHDCGRDLQDLRLYLDDDIFSETGVSEALRALDTWLERAVYILHDTTDFSDYVNTRVLSHVHAHSTTGTSELRADHRLEIICSFEDSVTMLMDLTPTIEDILALHKFLDPGNRAAAGSLTVTGAAQSWIARIAESYRFAGEALVQRLGEANWQRFCRLKAPQDPVIAKEYSRASSVFYGAAEAETADAKSATSSSIFQDSALGSSIHSAVGYAQSTVSDSSFVSNAIESNNHFHRVPPEPPEVADREPFVCPLCRKELHGIHNRLQWKIHVFHDLRPYVCLADNCPNLLRTFSTRSAWAEHDLTHHRKDTFECHDCRHIYRTRAEFRNHLSREHAQLTSEQRHKLEAIRPPPGIEDISLWCCPLCGSDSFTSPHKFRSHVCQHLEDIALAVVPSELYVQDDDGSSEASEQGWASNSSGQADSMSINVPENPIEQPSVPAEEQQIIAPSKFEAQQGVLKQGTKKTVRRKRRSKPKRPSVPLSQPSESRTSKADNIYPCTFHHFGCTAEFPNKNEWKRHIACQHLQLGYYRCDLDGCDPASTFSRHQSRAVAPAKPVSLPRNDDDQVRDPSDEIILVYNDFNRKDLFTQHCRRMHGPIRNPALCSNPPSKKNGILKPTKSDLAAFELQLVLIRKRCWRIRRPAPSRTSCCFCMKVFDADYYAEGDAPAAERAWEERIEHIGLHYEKERYTTEDATIDEDLVKWGLATGLLRMLPDSRPWLVDCADPVTFQEL